MAIAFHAAGADHDGRGWISGGVWYAVCRWLHQWSFNHGNQFPSGSIPDSHLLFYGGRRAYGEPDPALYHEIITTLKWKLWKRQYIAQKPGEQIPFLKMIMRSDPWIQSA